MQLHVGTQLHNNMSLTLWSSCITRITDYVHD